MNTPRLILTIVTASSLVASSLLAGNILPQGDFTDGAPGELPKGWSGHQQPHLNRINGAHKIEEENGEKFLRLEKVNEESVLKVDAVQELPVGTKEVTLTITDRVVDIIPGSENPNRNVLRVGVNFLDAQDQVVKEGTPQIARSRTAAEWKTDSVSYEVPEGVAKVSVSLMLLQCAGIWEIQTVELTTN